MSGIVRWINANSGLLSLAFSCVVALATVAYVVLTSKLVQESRALRESQVTPHVAVRVELNPVAFGFADLVVENFGPGPAYDVRFSFTPDLELEKNPSRHLSNIGFLRNGFRYLPARQPVSTFLSSLLGVPDEKMEGPDRLAFSVDVRYRDALTREHSEHFDIDFAHFVGLIRLGTPPLPDMAASLEKIKTAIEHIQSGWSKINVVQYAPEDITREHDNFRLAQLSRQLIEEATKDPDEAPGGADAA